MLFNTQEWLEEILISAEDDKALLERLPSVRPEIDVDGWGDLLADVRTQSENDEELGIHREDYPLGIILTGEDGCGKHTVAEIVALSIVIRNKYSFVSLYGDQLTEDTASKKEVVARLKALLEYYRSTGVCIILEDLDECFCRRTVERTLAKWLKLCAVDNLPFFLVLIERDYESVSSVLRGELRTVRLSPPNEEERLDILQTMAGQGLLEKLKRSSITIDNIVKDTDGYNYRQMRDLIFTLKLQMRRDPEGKMNTHQYLKMLDAQHSPAAEKTTRSAWMKSMTKFFESPHAVQQIKQTLPPQEITNTNVLENKTNKAKNMTEEEFRESIREEMLAKPIKEKIDKLGLDI